MQRRIDWRAMGNRGGGHLDLLHQLPLVSVHGVEAKHHVVLINVGRGVAQAIERLYDRTALLSCSGMSRIDLVFFDSVVAERAVAMFSWREP
jgi:hypothetical protein